MDIVAATLENCPVALNSFRFRARQDLAGLGYPSSSPLSPQDFDPCVAALRAHLTALASEGVVEAWAPLEGSTWRSYRLRVDGTPDEAPFLERAAASGRAPGEFASIGRPFPARFAWEPPRDPLLAHALRESGFIVGKRYHSHVFDTSMFPWVHRVFLRSLEAAARFGLRLVPLADVVGEPGIASRLHAVTLSAFRDNFLFEPLGFEEFAALYGLTKGASAAFRSRGIDASPSRALLDAEGVLQGYAYAFLQGDVAVVKTICVHPDVAARYGTGTWSASYAILASVHAAVRASGVPWYVSALVADEASSRHMARLHAPALVGLHEYALFCAKIESSVSASSCDSASDSAFSCDSLPTRIETEVVP